MAVIKLVYFEGCPNAQRVRESLEKIGYPFSEIEQTGLTNNNHYKNFASPTILKDENVIFGEKAEGGGCSLHIPSDDVLKNLLA